MKKKNLANSEEIAKLYTDTYRTRMPLYNDYVFHRIYGKLTYYRNRALFYGGRLVNSSLNSGETYDKMRKSIVVSIINPKLFPKEIGCHSIFDVREQNTGHRLCDRLEFHFLELGKVDPRKPIEEMTQIEKLAVYLRYANDENYKDSVQKICGSEEEIVMAENFIVR